MNAPHKYLVTIPNRNYSPGADLRHTLQMPCQSLKEARHVWKGTKGKQIYKLISKPKTK